MRFIDYDKLHNAIYKKIIEYVLTGDFTARYKIMKGEEYGKVTCVQPAV